MTSRTKDAVIVGAGLAGTAAARALTAAGWSVTLLDAEAGPASRASALPVGMLSPHVTRSPTPMSRLSALGVEATRHYLKAHLAQGQGWWDTEIDNLGHDPGRWPAAMVRPSALAGAWLREAADTGRLSHQWQATIHRIWRPADSPPGQAWELQDADGKTLASSPVVVVAGAWGSAALLMRSFGFDPTSLPLRPVKGQLSFGAWSGPALAERPRRDNGVYVPLYEDQAMPPGLPARLWAMGSTYERGQDNRGVTRDAHEKNLHSLTELHPAAAQHMRQSLDQDTILGWSDVRCASLDRVPLIGALPDVRGLQALMDSRGPRRGTLPMAQCPRLDGIHTVAALGSRGITLAYSSGEWLRQWLDTGRMDLEEDLAQAIDPARFAWRLLRRQPATTDKGHPGQTI